MKQRLSEAADAWLEYREMVEDRSKNTLMNDRSRMVKLLTHIGSNVYCENITNVHVTQSLIASRATCSPRSVAMMVSTYNVFFRWCQDTNRIPARCNPMAGVKAPKWHVEERNILPVDKFEPLIESARSPRDRILLVSALHSLKRSGEMTAWRYGDLDLNACKIRTHIFKSKKDDRTPIGEEWEEELRRWLTAYQEECGPLQPEWYLIPGRTSPIFLKGHDSFPALVDPDSAKLAPMKRFARPAYVAGYALKAVKFETRDPRTGKSKNEGMHTLRRAGGRARFDALRESGYDGALEELRETFNHKYVSMTEHYLGVTLGRMRRDENIIGKKFFPQLAKGPNVISLADRNPEIYRQDSAIDA